MGKGTQALYENRRLVLAGEGGVNLFDILSSLRYAYEVQLSEQSDLDWPLELDKVEEEKEDEDKEIYG